MLRNFIVAIPLLLAFVGLPMMAANPTTAGEIVSISGDLASVPQPSALNFNGTNFSGVTNPQPIIFNEYTDHLIPTFSALDPSTLAPFGFTPSDFIGLDYLPLDITGPGTYPPNAMPAGQINSGTMVSTYIINFEPSDTNPVGSATGSVTFSDQVLGIEFSFGAASIREYLFELPNVGLVGSSGFEICTNDPSTCDTVSLSADLHTVSFVSNVNGSTDDMRIFLAVPEPGTLSIFGIGLVGFWRLRRQRLSQRENVAPLPRRL